jgi:hypothetical protein
MRHTFVLHLAADIDGTDPEDLMGDVEDAITEAFEREVLDDGMPLREVDVECVDAYETGAAV